MISEREHQKLLKSLISKKGPEHITLLSIAISVFAHAGEEGQQATLAKSLLASSLLSQGTPIISQDALDNPGLAAFVSSVVQFRRNHSALLQPHHFSSSRELVWHGATIGCCPAVHVLHTAAHCCLVLHSFG